MGLNPGLPDYWWTPSHYANEPVYIYIYIYIYILMIIFLIQYNKWFFLIDTWKSCCYRKRLFRFLNQNKLYSMYLLDTIYHEKDATQTDVRWFEFNFLFPIQTTLIKLKSPIFLGRRSDGFMPSLKVLVLSETQTTSFLIWTLVANYMSFYNSLVL